jgi:hypothetical protein
MNGIRRSKSWAEIVAAHLTQRGHISEGSALIEYGRFRLGDAIFRLRNEKRHLLPEGKEIITINKQDTQGNRYGEYHLVDTKAAATRRILAEARAHTSEAA